MNIECKGLFGPRCNPKPRYNIVPPKDVAQLRLADRCPTAYGTAQVLEALSARTYVCDVCETCGKVIRQS